MAPHSSTLAWRIPWMEEPGRLQSWGCEELDTTERLHFHFSLSCIGEGNGNPLQCSCLENPRDGGAWRAAVCGVIQSRTQLKRISSNSSIAGSVLALGFLSLNDFHFQILNVLFRFFWTHLNELEQKLPIHEIVSVDLKKYFIFNWRIVDSQCCASFRHTEK